MDAIQAMSVSLHLLLQELFMRFLIVLAVAALAGCGPQVAHSTGDPVAGASSPQPASPGEVVLWVNGMGCPLCANNVDQQLMKLDGVEKARINLGSGQVFARLSPKSRLTREDFARAVKGTGFTLVKIEMP